MKPREDAFGAALLDHLEGRRAHEICERDDGFLDVSAATPGYFELYEEWSPTDREVAARVRGRVLDIGCGAGRFALHLQEAGHEVVAIDISPGAVEVCRRRGVRDVRQRALAVLGPDLGSFDTVLMMGNNFALFGTPSGAREGLARLHALTAPDAQILAEALDPHDTEDPAHLAYQARNRAGGRLSGQLRLRVRYRELATPWFDFLLVSEEEMRGILVDTPWEIEEVLAPAEGPTWVACLRKREA